jgi:hypothetical protein
MRRNGLLVRYGMAHAAYPVNYCELTDVRIRVFCDNTALVQCGTQDLGTGTSTVAG